MSRHFFKIINGHDWSSVDAPAVIVKNVTAGPFEVDEDGRSLHSMGIAAIDDSCSKCAEGIKEGKLVVLDKIGNQKSTKPKTKNVPEPKQEPESTVAPPEDNDSVQ